MSGEGNDSERAGFFDPLKDSSLDRIVVDNLPNARALLDASEQSSPKKIEKPMVRFWTLPELRAYIPSDNSNLLGDYHLQPGAISVFAGMPGCGKSRSSLLLAAALARGSGDWFGLQVRARCKVMILQNENSLTRLHRDIEAMAELFDGLDEMVKISEVPDYGLALANPHFRGDMRKAVADFAPGLLIVDPWNACVRDDMAEAFSEGLAHLREILVAVPEKCGCLVIHHLRKPRETDNQRGRGLAHLLAGSYLLISVARSVLVLQPASDDIEDHRVVFTTAKNNDGELGPRSAWRRTSGGFQALTNFDWETFDGKVSHRESIVTEAHIRAILDDGRKFSTLPTAVENLKDLVGCGRSTAYAALKAEGGRFSHMLSFEGPIVSLKNIETLRSNQAAQGN